MRKRAVSFSILSFFFRSFPFIVAWKRPQTGESALARKWREGQERAEAAERDHSPNRKGSAMGREIQDRVELASAKGITSLRSDPLGLLSCKE